jgi:uncharacterized protein YehS (DUF1456 family)
MNNNDILKRLRYTFDLSDGQMQTIFDLAGKTVSPEQLMQWFKPDDDPLFDPLKDRHLAIFLNGLISHFRGKKEGPLPEPERKLTHNLILRKLKIALNLQAEDMLEIWEKVDFRLSKHELSSFFRQPSHRNYRLCQDQVLRNFLQGLQIQRRPESQRADSLPVEEQPTEA